MALEGKTIERVRKMTDAEMEREGWDDLPGENPACVELADGTVLFPSKTSGGDAPGELFGYDPNEDEAFVYG